jgi:hypothetical protein
VAVVLSNLFEAKLTTIKDRMYFWNISPYIIEDTINSIERTQEFSILEFLVFENTKLNNKELTTLGKQVAEAFFTHKNKMPDRGLRYAYMNNLPRTMSFLLQKKVVYVYDYEDWKLVLKIVRSFI